MKRRPNRLKNRRCGKRAKGEMECSPEVIAEKHRRVEALAQQYEKLGISGKLLNA